MKRTLIGLVAAMALVTSACAGTGGTSQAQGASALDLTPTTVAGSPAQAQSVAGDATNEGIQVHGRWTIEVLDADGTVKERRAFENALTGSGKTLLANLLTGTTAVDSWSIGVRNTGTGCPESNYDQYLASPTVSIEGSTVVLSSVGQVSGIESGADTYTFQYVATLANTTPAGSQSLTCRQITPLTIQRDDPVRVRVELSFS